MLFNKSIISVKNLSKSYRIYKYPFARILYFFLKNIKFLTKSFESKLFKDISVLDDITFTVNKGHTVGVIGFNGSGKSTLLQIISGITMPTSGTIEVNEKIVALLELGAGFNPEFTGKENIFIYASILGLTKKEIEERLDKIISFSELGSFIDQPIKRYSSGMYARLAFSVAMYVDGQIMIIDETLSVGDFRFQQKCIREIKKLKKNGKTIFFVSHDSTLVKSICDYAMLINRGKLISYGNTNEVINEYFALSNFKNDRNLDNDLSDSQNAIKNKHNFIDFLSLNYSADIGVSVFKGMIDYGLDNNAHIIFPGSKIKINLLISLKSDLEKAFFGFMLKDEKGIDVCGYNSLGNDKSYDLKKNVTYSYTLVFNLPPLTAKKYSIDFAVSSGTWEIHNHKIWVYDGLVFKVESNERLFNSHTYIALGKNQIISEVLKGFDE